MNGTGEKAVRIGVIGCGAIAELYHLPALQAHPVASVGIRLADTNERRLAEVGRKFACLKGVTDYRELEGDVDGVIIATPPASHYPIAKWFLERGVHVLCEKPLSESAAEARELVETAREAGVKLAVNQTRRLFPTYQKIRELIAAGTLGELTSIRYHDGVEFDWPAASPHHFTSGAKGVWSDTGVHLLDSVCYWLSAPHQTTAGSVSNPPPTDAAPRLVRSQTDSAGGPEAVATVHLVHDACEIEIKVSRLGRLSNGFRIVGTQGSIEAEAEDWDEFTVQFTNGRQRRFRCASNRLKYTDFARPLIANFVDVIAADAEPLVTGASTLATIQLLEQAYARAEPFPAPWNAHLTQWTSDARYAETWDESRPMRVLVTGASGFIGGRVAEVLAISGIATPVAAIRNWSRAARVACHPMEIVVCDIMNAAQVDVTVSRVDAIVHCAYTDDRDTIVTGTKNLLAAAQRHRVGRFVYLSSAEVYGPTLAGAVDEQALATGGGRPYGAAKAEAEELVRRHGAGAMAVTILRPSLVYGPFGESWSVDVAARLQSGKWGLFDELGEGTANLVYVDDLAQAILLSLFREEARDETFNVNGPERPTWNQYFQQFNQALGLPPLARFSAPRSRWRTRLMDVARGVTSAIKTRFQDRLMEIYLRGGWASRVMKRIKGQLDMTPSGAELDDLYSRQASYEDDKIRKVLGYQPAFDLATGIERTIQWLRHHERIRSTPAPTPRPKAAESPEHAASEVLA